MKAHDNLVSLREKVQHYLDTGEVPIGFHPTCGICGNCGVEPSRELSRMMNSWSHNVDIDGEGEFPVDGGFHNYYERKFTRWDQSTEWGRNRLALLDWLIIETGKLGI